MDPNNEDGEIPEDMRHHSREEHDDDEFSMSSYDGDQTDSLVIKPPQAIVQKREKRPKREHHRHKGERHKDRHRSREHEERKRKHREQQRRDGRRREKHRSAKHERLGLLNLRSKLTKERKVTDRELQQWERRRERMRDREEMLLDERDYYEQEKYREHFGPRGGYFGEVSHHHHHHRLHRAEERAFHMQGNLMDLQLSPREKAERDKRMERFMVAEKQKEMSQREADQRRQRREEERREELRQKAEVAILKNSDPRRHLDLHKELETVELISDDDDGNLSSFLEETLQDEEELSSKEKAKNRKKRKKMDEESDQEVEEEEEEEEEEEAAESKGSSSSITLPTSDSESSSSGSESEDEDEDEGDDEDEVGAEERISTVKVEKELPPPPSPPPSHSASSSDRSSEEGEKGDSDAKAEEKKEILDDSPPPEDKEGLPPYFPAIMGCRSVDEFECLNRIAEGTYGVVYRAREKATNEIVALKRLKMEKEKEGFPITSLREVNTLLKGQHENIVTVREIVVGSNMDKIYIVMDYVEHDMKSLMEMMTKKNQTFTIGEVKTLMLQLLNAVHHLHDNWILHRDLKTSNLLLSHRGILKVGDFGLAREYGSPLKQYTPIVVTLWYRAPELLLGTKEYSCPIDVWSVGCIFGEFLGMEPMFPGKSEIDQLNKIFKDLGTPSDKIWPGYSRMPVIQKTQFAYYPYNHLKERLKNVLSIEGFNLLNSFLTYKPEKRITCIEALKHNYFRVEDPAPIDPAMFPTWPAKSENPHGREKKGLSPKPPSGGKNFKALGDEEDKIAGFFLGGAPPSGPGFQLKF